ncbi:LysR family transcriptional regulator [Pseudomonadota bacterium]
MTNKLKQFYYKKSRIQQLKGFCYTVQFGSIAKASEYMGLSATAVALQIQALEGDLNVKLFERTANRLVITKEGRTFYNLAILPLQGFDSLFETFHAQINEENRNTLSITGSYSSISCILPKYIKKLTEQKAFEYVQIGLYNTDNREEAFNKLIKGDTDIAFYQSHGDGKNIPVEIEEERIFKSRFALFLNKTHPLAKRAKITKEDVEKYECLMIDKFTFYDPVQSVNFKKSRIHLGNGNSHIIMELVKKNVEMGAGNEVYKNVGSNVVFKNIDHLLPKMFYSLFTLKNKQQKESASYLINELRKDKKGVLK